ncbi:DNA polymerase zeta catalytic subunit [Blomia tropicalis]|nr:DNA polymerase zeta catalytic subunit [Blomia tropicalis]
MNKPIESSKTKPVEVISNILKANIFQIDSYQCKPLYTHDKVYSLYRQKCAKSATVVRIFGSTDNGNRIKVCLHLHQYFPHFSIRKNDLAASYGLANNEDHNQSINEKDIIEIFIGDLEYAIQNRLINENGLSNADEPRKNDGRSDGDDDEHYIYNVKPYMSTSIYGFHSSPEMFVRFYFYSNWIMEIAKTILQSSSINNYPFVVYDCLEFTLQFYIDSQVYLNSIQIRDVTFRKNPNIDSIETNSNETNEKLNSLKLQIEWNDIPPSSTCFLECDSTVENIILSEHVKHFPQNKNYSPSLPGIIKLWNDQYFRYMKNYQILGAFLEKDEVCVPNVAPITNFTHINDSEPTLYDIEEIENEDLNEMNLTLKDLDLCDNLGSNELSQSLYCFDDFNVPERREDGFKIPQLDGMDDLDEGEMFMCAYRGKNIKLSLKQMSVELPKISAKHFINSNKICVNNQLKDRLPRKTKRAFESEIFYPDLEDPFFQYFHSTPQVSCKSSSSDRLHKKSRNNKKLSLQDMFEQTIEENVSPKVPKTRISFDLSQSSINENVFMADISSIISNNTSQQSFDSLPIETYTTLEWNRSLGMSVMSLELYACTRGDLIPNPNIDQIQFVTFCLYNEILSTEHSSLSDDENIDLGLICAIVVKPNQKLKQEKVNIGGKMVQMVYVSSEVELLQMLIHYVQTIDPDIMCGYEVDTRSWGFILQRCCVLGIEISAFSRITNHYQSRGNLRGSANTPPQVVGRIVLNIWNIMRKEVTLRTYVFENVYQHMMKERIPKFKNSYLNSLWANKPENQLDRYRVLEYYLIRTLGTIKMLCRTNLVSRTFDLSCLFGMRFEDVLNRGSQFRIESILLPLCRLENFVPIRFNKEYVRQQATPECIQLVMEPESALYREPVAVLDFQSLYPSVMIAYNYCYTTCLGKMKNIFRGNQTFGCYRLKTNRTVLQLLRDDIHISPNEVLFVKPNVRRGLLPKMLEDLLLTRVLVKNEMKQLSSLIMKQGTTDSTTRRLKMLKQRLDVCQLGLKMVANFTYGYTNANYSGRMPCADVADSIVSKGREALEQTIAFINQWGKQSGTGAKVIYGDTDSVFISFPGATKEDAFKWCHMLVKKISARHPYPMKIKLEKIFQPCLLLSKKRYCGYAYESPTQASPVFDAKGIETVRRDNCNAASKIMKRCIKILFETGGDIEQIKSYMQWQIKKIFNGRLSNVNDFIFGKEFWGLAFYTNQTVMPSCIIARQRLSKDPLAEPKRKDRVPYVIVSGQPTDRVADLVRDPDELLENRSLQLNAAYYIQRAIFPALTRVLEVLPGFEYSILMEWYEEVRHFRTTKLKLDSMVTGNDDVQQYFQTSLCVLCQRKIGPSIQVNNLPYPLCEQCMRSSQRSIVMIKERVHDASRRLHQFERICAQCTGGSGCHSTFNNWGTPRHQCRALTCSILFRYHQAIQDYNIVNQVDQHISSRFDHLNPIHHMHVNRLLHAIDKEDDRDD